jgi:hypothetical protein
MLLVFEATVYRHQIHHYCQVQCSPPAVQTLFPAATRDTLDQGLMNGLKYLLNYAFYKFGLEVCWFCAFQHIVKQQPLVFIPYN